MLGLFSGIAGGGVWIAQHHGLPGPLHPFLLFATVMHTSIALFVGALLRFIPAGRFDEASIRTFNTLALLRTMRWDNVTLVKKVNFPFIKYLLLYTPNSKWALWVPLNITNRKELIDFMTKSNNPIFKNVQET